MERLYLDRAICHEDVKKNQQQYMFFCSNYDLKELIDLRPKNGSVYIKSVCEPFDIEMEIDWARVNNWIDHFGMTVTSTHVSGHASAPVIKDFITSVKPKTVIPIHTEHANYFQRWHSNVLLLESIGQSVTL